MATGEAYREIFTLFVDNLPPSMSCVWLKKIFRNDGEVVDVYVSKKKRVNKKGCFGFVHFSKKEDEEVARRNNRLLIKGFQIRAMLSKYQRMESNKTVPQRKQPSKSKKGTKKVWRPSMRDARSYSEVTKLMVQAQNNSQLCEWLQKAYICSEEEMLEPQQALDKINESGLESCCLYKLDDYSVLVYKKNENNESMSLKEGEEATLESCFNYIAVWHKDYSLRFFRRFELLGIPVTFAMRKISRR